VTEAENQREAGERAKGGTPLPRPRPLSRPAAWWAWPLIVVSLALVIASVVQPSLIDAEQGESGAEPSRGNATGLVMLRFQAKVIIGSATIASSQVERDLRQLWDRSTEPEERAALALVASFLKAEAFPDPAMEKHWADLAPERRELLQQALTDGVTEAERAELETWLGWFARLASGPGLTEPEGAGEIRREATVAMVTAGLLILAGGGAWFLGAGLLGYYILVKRKEVDFHAYRPEQSAPGVLLESFALYLGFMAAGEVLTYWHHIWQIVGFCMALVFPLLWPRIRGVRWRELAAAVGWTRGRGFWREAGAGVVGYLVLLAMASGGVAVTLMLSEAAEFGRSWAQGASGETPPMGPQEHPIVGFLVEGNWSMRVALLLLAVVYAPLVEEIFFRGGLQGYLRSRWRFVGSALLTGVIFAALHPQGLWGIPALASISFALSLLREWRGSLIAPMVAHALNNGVITGLLLIAL